MAVLRGGGRTAGFHLAANQVGQGIAHLFGNDLELAAGIAFLPVLKCGNGLGQILLQALELFERQCLNVDLPEGLDASAWPCVIDIDEHLYFKPDAGRLLVSPADETPSMPCDAWADDLDVAEAVERLETMTSLRVTQVRSRWAGLRTFAPDRTPIVGFDPELPGFFWLAGQGGYGLQTAPAMARAAAALASGSAWPADLAAEGVQPEQLAPRRFA